MSDMNYPFVRETWLLQVLLPSVLTDGPQRDKKDNSSVGFSPFNTRTILLLFKGVKTHKGRGFASYFYIRRLKPTAKEPVTKQALFMTDCLFRIAHFFLKLNLCIQEWELCLVPIRINGSDLAGII